MIVIANIKSDPVKIVVSNPAPIPILIIISSFFLVDENIDKTPFYVGIKIFTNYGLIM
jgi:hypothetical protein